MLFVFRFLRRSGIFGRMIGKNQSILYNKKIPVSELIIYLTQFR